MLNRAVDAEKVSVRSVIFFIMKKTKTAVPDNTLAYLAGFIDADGSITIVTHHVKNRPSYRAKISAYNCKLAPIQLLKDTFGGGKLRYRKPSASGRNSDKWRECYEWTLTAKQAEIALEKLLPFLMIKRSQAIQCLRLRKIQNKHNKAQRRWHPDLDIKCRRIFQKLKERCNKLNKRGL